MSHPQSDEPHSPNDPEASSQETLDAPALASGGSMAAKTGPLTPHQRLPRGRKRQTPSRCLSANPRASQNCSHFARKRLMMIPLFI